MRRNLIYALSATAAAGLIATTAVAQDISEIYKKFVTEKIYDIKNRRSNET